MIKENCHKTNPVFSLHVISRSVFFPSISKDSDCNDIWFNLLSCLSCAWSTMHHKCNLCRVRSHASITSMIRATSFHVMSLDRWEQFSFAGLTLQCLDGQHLHVVSKGAKCGRCQLFCNGTLPDVTAHSTTFRFVKLFIETRRRCKKHWTSLNSHIFLAST